MTMSPRVLLAGASFAFAANALAADPPAAPDRSGSAPETVRVASTESVAAGQEGRKFAFVLVKSESGACYAIAPPGGEGMTAGDRYAVVPANDVSDATRAEMTKDHPTCKVVDVVARIAR